MIDKTLVAKRFNKNIHSYQETAPVQYEMAAILTDEVWKLDRQYEAVFEAGAGSGNLTHMVLDRFQPAKYFVNDITSASGVLLLKQHINLSFLQGDIEKLELPGDLDLFISNAVFQWIDDRELLFKKIHAVLNAGGIFAFSTFGVENFIEFNRLGVGLQTYTTVNKMQSMLSKRFEMINTLEYTTRLYFDSVLELFKHVSKSGVTGVTKTLNPGSLRHLMKAYSELYLENGKFGLTYQPQIYIARKI